MTVRHDCDQRERVFLQNIPHLLVNTESLLGVDRLSAPILSILPIIDIGHFKNRFTDNFYFFIFFMQTNILFTGDIVYW